MKKEMKKTMVKEMINVLTEKNAGTKISCNNISKILIKGYITLFIREETLYHIDNTLNELHVVEGVSDMYDIRVMTPHIIIKTNEGKELLYSLLSFDFVELDEDKLTSFIKYGNLDDHIDNTDIKYSITSLSDIEYIIGQDNRIKCSLEGQNDIDLNYQIPYDTNADNLNILVLRDNTVCLRFTKEKKMIIIDGIKISISDMSDYDKNIVLSSRVFDNEIRAIRPLLNKYIGNKMINSDEYVNYEKIAEKAIKKYIKENLRG